ncbi:hypothetical protein NUW58_g2092 [Xylaria curta]|uniref:Uncharacterized protein n=1 Tax=Xylaria curta TaxID=42375 RepID=A0ACC1PHF5_9PEZI|nr:hypothetical protein NUW58_g2092 [Xylaria curta]
MADVTDRLNESLQLSMRRSTYASVKVLALYWQDGHQGYKNEAQAVVDLFRHSFQYSAEEFAIPSSNSYNHVLGLMTNRLLELGEAAANARAASLLIIHYGGHGDRDNDKHQGQEKRSVWAAHREGDPTLPWYLIQDQFDNLRNEDTHILLILDCCYAGQAARQREIWKTRIEILAASAMGMETPPPGNTSFTDILLREIKRQLETCDSIVVKEFYTLLSHRQSQLWAQPVYISLKPREPPIRLQPLSQASHMVVTKRRSGMDPESLLHLIIEIKDDPDKQNITEIARWLGAETPRIVTSLVFENTEHISRAVDKISQEPGDILSRLDSVSKQEIDTAWYGVVDLVRRYYDEQHSPSHPRRQLQDNNQKVIEFLRRLDFCNSSVVSALERNLLGQLEVQDNTPSVEEDIENAVNDDTMRALGLADGFRMRQIISQSELSEPVESHDVLYGAATKNSREFIEVKNYNEYVDPAELPILIHRISLLSDLLQTPKSSGFRSLKCLRWEHRPLQHKFNLYFEVPSGYKLGDNCHQTLRSVIRTAKLASRPTMDSRMAIALSVCMAIQKWHSVGWVHQSINSRNIIFFQSETTGELDYLCPYLQGFEFSRQDHHPSIVSPMDDFLNNIYRHPQRQGTMRQGHRKIHDIYSLGVVLLEIGLWQTAEEMLKSHKQSEPHTIREILKKSCSIRLAHYAGVYYQSAVSACLDSDLGVDMDNEKGSNLARAFELKVISMIRICPVEIG